MAFEASAAHALVTPTKRINEIKIDLSKFVFILLFVAFAILFSLLLLFALGAVLILLYTFGIVLVSISL